MTKTTLDTLVQFLEKARARLSDEQADYSDMDEENSDPDSDMMSERDESELEGDAADKWLNEHSATVNKEPTKTKGGDLQPSPEELAEMREYTRPWAARAKAREHLEAQPHVNPVKHHHGLLIESRNMAHGDRQKAYEDFTNSDEYKNADPITQMEMDSKFHEDWHAKNPEHLSNALSSHHEAHKKGESAKELFEQAKDENIRHVASGASQPGAYSLEEGVQHVGGSREDDDSAPSGIQQDPSAQFAAGNQEFLQQYMQNYDKRAKKFSNLADLDNLDQGTRANISDVLGQHEGLKDPSKKRKVDNFVAKYHPLIGQAAKRVISKLGLQNKVANGQIDPGLLHEAGVHALFQAINDYDHNHPSKAKFVTHLNNKLSGLMQTALKAQDKVPAALRAGAKRFDKESGAINAGPVTHIDKQGNKTIIPVNKPSVQEIVSKHPPEVQDRLKRVAAARPPMKRQAQPKPAVAPKMNTSPDESGEF